MPKKRCRLYLESSFWRRLGDPASSPRRILSYRFLRRAGRSHKFLVSQVVAEELAEMPSTADYRAILRRWEAWRTRKVPWRAAIQRVAEELLATGGWSRRRFADMLHLSYAVVGSADALVTWDLHDLASPQMRRILHRVVKRLDLPEPRIGTPLEVAKWLGLEIE